MDIIELICHSKNNLGNQSWFVIIAIAWSTGNAVINLTPSKEAIGDKNQLPELMHEDCPNLCHKGFKQFAFKSRLVIKYFLRLEK